jgi:hypothetical protein
MAIDTRDITVVIIGLGGCFLARMIAARMSDSNPEPIASTTATELTKTVPS